MRKFLDDKLKTLPSSPGVYLYKDSAGEIIYVGKAAVLKNRVRQYFQKSRLHDPKTDALMSEIVDIDWMEVDNELDALFLEAELVRRYLPKYNILLRDDKSSVYVRIDMQSDYPFISYTHRPLDDGAEYIGPFYSASIVRKALRVLRKIFPYSTHRKLPKRVCLQYHLGLCPGLEENKISIVEYKKTLRDLIRYLHGGKSKIIRQFEQSMKTASEEQRYEDAVIFRNKLTALKHLNQQIIFSDSEFIDISKDIALTDLMNLLSLPKPPKRIEGYDISHMSGTNNVASMVVFENGLPAKSEYRKFAMKIKGNDDFEHMREVVRRRFSTQHSKWPEPDLLLIDGGKGQLDAVLSIIRPLGINIPAIGLAKKQELIIISKWFSNVHVNQNILSKLTGYLVDETEDYLSIDIPNNSHVIKLLQRIRDESHRFAVSYHSHLKRTNQLKNKLEEIPGIGPKTRKILIKQFGSVSQVLSANLDELTVSIGPSKARIILNHTPQTSNRVHNY